MKTLDLYQIKLTHEPMQLKVVDYVHISRSSFPPRSDYLIFLLNSICREDQYTGETVWTMVNKAASSMTILVYIALKPVS